MFGILRNFKFNMWFKKGTAPRVKAKPYSLPPNLNELIKSTELTIASMPADSSIFLMDENQQLVQIRSQKDYEKYQNLLKPTSGRTPFLMYANKSSIDKVIDILRAGPQPNP